MKLSDIGEFGLIERIKPPFLDHLDTQTLGIGDDCAILPLDDYRAQLVTTDLLIENVHFLRQKISPEDLGFKALAVNLSDIAAMGGAPTGAFLSIGLPADTSLEWIDGFFKGIRELAEQSNTPLLGGDTTKSENNIIINIAVLGQMPRDQVKLRSAARQDDIICLTGNIGDSGVGLQLILNQLDQSPNQDEAILIQQHNHPHPHLEEGQWLSRQDAVHAMLDVSDGIDSDIKHILNQSNLGAIIEPDKLPVSQQARRTCEKYDWNALEIAATGGEDYCLACTIDYRHVRQVSLAFETAFNRPLYEIGRITNSGHLEYKLKSGTSRFLKKGFDHFKD